MFLTELAQILLGGVQLFLGVRDQLTVGGNLFIGGIHLAVQKGNFLIDGAFLLHNALHIVVIGIVLALNGIDLLLNLRVFGFQRVNLLLYLRGGRRVGLHREQAEGQRRSQKQGQHGGCKSMCTHKKWFLKQDFCLSRFGSTRRDAYTFINFRMEVQLPTIPTNIPAAAKTITMGISSSWKGTKLNSCRASTAAIF